MSRHEIIDAHLHFMTVGLRRRWTELLHAMHPDLAKVAERHMQRRLEQGGNDDVVLPHSAEQAAQWWLEHFDRNGVAMGAFMCGIPETEEMRRFLAASDRFVGITWLSANDPEAPAILEREVAAGMRMVKLYPPLQHYHLNDRACYPFYEACARLEVPVLIHMGISMGYYADLTYANPLDLHRPARDLPEVTFIVAHFGAGFLRECLMLAYQAENVCFDSSGSNSWLKYQGIPLTLEDVFRRFLDAAGPERLLYGSDSTVFPRGYRTNVLQDQLEILERLDLTDDARALILGGNARRLLRLAPRPALVGTPS